jgi:hypothetical protein
MNLTAQSLELAGLIGIVPGMAGAEGTPEKALGSSPENDFQKLLSGICAGDMKTPALKDDDPETGILFSPELALISEEISAAAQGNPAAAMELSFTPELMAESPLISDDGSDLTPNSEISGTFDETSDLSNAFLQIIPLNGDLASESAAQTPPIRSETSAANTSGLKIGNVLNREADKESGAELSESPWLKTPDASIDRPGQVMAAGQEPILMDKGFEPVPIEESTHPRTESNGAQIDIEAAQEKLSFSRDIFGRQVAQEKWGGPSVITADDILTSSEPTVVDNQSADDSAESIAGKADAISSILDTDGGRIDEVLIHKLRVTNGRVYGEKGFIEVDSKNGPSGKEQDSKIGIPSGDAPLTPESIEINGDNVEVNPIRVSSDKTSRLSMSAAADDNVLTESETVESIDGGSEGAELKADLKSNFHELSKTFAKVESHTTPAKSAVDPQFSGAIKSAGATQADMPETLSATARFVMPLETKAANLRNGQTIMIKMEPEHLGNVRLTLSGNNDSITGRLIVENSAAQTAVESNLDDLYDQLTRHGVKIDHFEVSVGGGQIGQSYNENGSSPDVRRPIVWSKKTGDNGGGAPVPDIDASSRMYIGAGGVNWIA